MFAAYIKRGLNLYRPLSTVFTTRNIMTRTTKPSTLTLTPSQKDDARKMAIAAKGCRKPIYKPKKNYLNS